jgi:tetratricopeptide (TPR) repeat protein
LAAAYIAQAIANPANASSLIDKAQAQLDIAARLNAAPEVNANLATAALFKGNAYAAYNYANRASALRGDNAAGLNGVKGSAAIITGRYSEAVSAESSAANTADNLFNKGLAQVLNKDYQNALTSFNEAIRLNSNHALAHYGAAVASARMGNADAVVSNLANAVKADPSLKEMALTDLEFAKWNDTEAFRNALK